MQIVLETADTENTSPIKYFGVGEIGVFITNFSTQKCQRNFATGAVENSIAGSVPLTSDIASFTSQSNFVQTAIAEAAVMSIFSVFRPKASASFAASNYTNTGNMGIGLWANGTGQLSFFASRDNGSGSPALSSATISAALTLNNWVLASGNSSASGNTVNNHTAVTTASLASTNARLLQANAIRVGSSWGGTFVGAADHLITVIVPGILTAPQTTSLLAALRAYALKHGITV